MGGPSRRSTCRGTTTRKSRPRPRPRSPPPHERAPRPPPSRAPGRPRGGLGRPLRARRDPPRQRRPRRRAALLVALVAAWVAGPALGATQPARRASAAPLFQLEPAHAEYVPVLD